jgi:hypothetical protein
MPRARAGKPQNRALRTSPPATRSDAPVNRAVREDEPEDIVEELTPEEAQEASEMEIRTAAKSGLPYATIAEKYTLAGRALTIEDVQAIIQPDLVQRVDARTQELMDA